MSIDGIEYFPQEFASKDFVQNMLQRKAKQLRLQRMKERAGLMPDQVHTHVEEVRQQTQQNEESAIQVLSGRNFPQN
jgi:hypothetical protein